MPERQAVYFSAQGAVKKIRAVRPSDARAVQLKMEWVWLLCGR